MNAGNATRDRAIIELLMPVDYACASMYPKTIAITIKRRLYYCHGSATTTLSTRPKKYLESPRARTPAPAVQTPTYRYSLPKRAWDGTYPPEHLL